MRRAGVVPLAGLLIAASPLVNIHGRSIVAAADQGAPVPAIRVTITQGLLTVSVRNVPVADLLRVIGDRAALRVAIWGGGGTLVTDSFADVRLDDGIRRLGRWSGLVLLYAPTGATAGAGVLTEVRVYDPAAANHLQGDTGARDQPGAADSVDDHGEAMEFTPAEPQGESDPQAGAQSERAARLLAMQELARQRDQVAAATLAQLLTQDADPIVRGKAAAALAEVGGAEATASLPTAMRDEDPWVRIQAIRAFGTMEDDRAAQVLSGVLTGDPDPRVRRRAVLALAARPTEEGRWALRAALSDPDPSVRQAVASALSYRRRQAVVTP